MGRRGRCCWPRRFSTASAPLPSGSSSGVAVSTTPLAWAEEIADLAPLTIAGHKLALERLETPA